MSGSPGAASRIARLSAGLALGWFLGIAPAQPPTTPTPPSGGAPQNQAQHAPATPNPRVDVLHLLREPATPMRLFNFTGTGPAWESESLQRPTTFTHMVLWGAAAPLRPGTILALADGSLLRADLLKVSGEEVLAGENPQAFRAETPLWREIKVARGAVRGVFAVVPDDLLERDLLLDELRSVDRDADQVWLRDGRVVRGQLLPCGDGAGAVETLRILVQGREVEVQWSQLLALRLRASEAPYDDRLAEISRGIGVGHLGWEFCCDEGSRVRTAEYRRQDDLWRLRIVGGHALADPEVLYTRLCGVRRLDRRVVDLSQVTVESERHVPFVGDRQLTSRDNRNINGGTLRVGGREYPHGIGMTSTTRRTYALDPYVHWERLVANVGVDDLAQGGSVRFRIFVRHGEQEGSGEWQEAAASPLCRGGEPPRSLEADVQGANGVALIVDFGEAGDVRDMANWLDVRLERLR